MPTTVQTTGQVFLEGTLSDLALQNQAELRRSGVYKDIKGGLYTEVSALALQNEKRLRDTVHSPIA